MRIYIKPDVPLKLYAFAFLCFVCSINLKAQKAVSIDKHTSKYILSYNEIECLEDPLGQFSIADVTSPAFNKRFKPSKVFVPKNDNQKSTYWFRIKVSNAHLDDEARVIEFYDQTIDSIAFYEPIGNQQYKQILGGSRYLFKDRLYKHKNFTIKLNRNFIGDHVYYFSIKSKQPANVMMALKPMNSFIEYGLKEYLLFGIFYGMILIFSFYNLMMFFAVRQVQYLYYILYNMSIAMFEMSSNGIAYQYLWPNWPEWNEIAFGVALFFATSASLLFTREFLQVKSRVPTLNKVMLGVITLRALFFLYCLLIDEDCFNYKYIEILPLMVCYYAGWHIWRKGYPYARFFVAGYSFLLLGVTVRVLQTVLSVNLPFGPANFYILSFCFIIEMLFLSFAIGDKVRVMKKKKDNAQQQMIQQMKISQELKDNINKELEQKVFERTKEVLHKSDIIEKQNEELLQQNELLNAQAEEIKRMNALLAEDNQTLQTNIEVVTQARVLSKNVNFEEFSKTYPDDIACFKFLSELKWNEGYQCDKCGGTHYYKGRVAYSRRCSTCNYQESVIMNTIFQNTKIPINKAFYMVFLVYSTKGEISSYKLSEMLSLRQGTCWTFSDKIKKIIKEKRKELKSAGEMGWSKLVIEKKAQKTTSF